MKILFINKLFTLTTLGREPLGLLYLAASLKKAGHVVRLADAGRPRNLFKMIESFQPRLLVYPIVRTGFHRFYLSLNQRIQRRYRLPTVWGGPHPTFFPRMIEEEGVDFVCRGEGEDALVELADRLQSGEFVDSTANFWVKKDDGRIIKNPPRPLISDLDRVPFPDRGLLRNLRLYARFPVKSFLAGRGCPYGCAYCFNPPMRELYGNPKNYVRRRSVNNLVSEIAAVKEQYPLQFVQFEDDIFPPEEKWLEEFAQRYRARIALPFAVNLRPETVQIKPLLDLLKKAGCHSVNLGLETAGLRLQEQVLNRRVPEQRLLEACRLVRSRGLRLLLEVMLGLPESRLEDDIATLELATRCRPDYCVASLFQPYPGTMITRAAYFHTPIDYDRLSSFYSSSPLDLPQKREVENLRRLFAPAVALRLPSRRIRKTLRYPLGPLYSLLSVITKLLLGKLRLVPVKLTPADYFLILKELLHR